MQKMTLLEMVQNIASAIETDEVNSITDTTESLQIAEVIKETFYELFTNTDLPEHYGLVRLESLSDLNSPNYLRIPDDVNKIEWIKYKDFVTDNPFPVPYVNPRDFVEGFVLNPNDGSSALYTQVTDPESGVQYWIRCDAVPSCYTIFNDKYVAFDSFDQANEATLEGINSLSWGSFNYNFLMEDDFVPPIDANLFPLLLAEAKSVCFINQKQVSSAKEEQRSKRQKRKFAREKFKSRVAQSEHINRRNNYARNR